METNQIIESDNKKKFVPVLNEIVEYFDDFKKEDSYQTSVYMKINKTPSDKNFIFNPQKGTEGYIFNLYFIKADFAQYSDASYLYPWDVITYIFSRVLVLLLFNLAEYFAFAFMSGGGEEYALYGALTVDVLFVPSLIFLSMLLFRVVKQLCSKKKSYYSMLKKVKFNKENKDELRELMKDNEILREIFQIKYGRNIFMLNLLRYCFFFIGEDGEVWYFTKKQLKIKFISSVVIFTVSCLVFFISFFLIPALIININDSLFYNFLVIFSGVLFANYGLSVIYWIIVYNKILKNRKFKIS